MQRINVKNVGISLVLGAAVGLAARFGLRGRSVTLINRAALTLGGLTALAYLVACYRSNKTTASNREPSVDTLPTSSATSTEEPSDDAGSSASVSSTDGRSDDAGSSASVSSTDGRSGGAGSSASVSSTEESSGDAGSSASVSSTEESSGDVVTNLDEGDSNMEEGSLSGQSNSGGEGVSTGSLNNSSEGPQTKKMTGVQSLQRQGMPPLPIISPLSAKVVQTPAEKLYKEFQDKNYDVVAAQELDIKSLSNSDLIEFSHLCHVKKTPKVTTPSKSGRSLTNGRSALYHRLRKEASYRGIEIAGAVQYD